MADTAPSQPYPQADDPSQLPVPPRKSHTGLIVLFGSIAALALIATVAVVVVARAGGDSAGASGTEIGHTELDVPSEAYPGTVDVVVRRSTDCTASLDNAQQARLDLSCLNVEVTPRGEFGANFLLTDSGSASIGEGVVDLGLGGVSTAYRLSLAVVSADPDAPWNDCAAGLCVDGFTEMTIQPDGSGLGEDDEMFSFDTPFNMGDVVTLEKDRSVVLTGTGSTFPTSRGNLEQARDDLFAVVYAVTTQADGNAHFWVIAVQAYGDGELEAQQVLDAFIELA